MCTLRNLVMKVWEMVKGGRCVGAWRKNDCGAMGTDCSKAVLEAARDVHLGKIDKTAWSLFGLLCSMLPTG